MSYRTEQLPLFVNFDVENLASNTTILIMKSKVKYEQQKILFVSENLLTQPVVLQILNNCHLTSVTLERRLTI